MKVKKYTEKLFKHEWYERYVTFKCNYDLKLNPFGESQEGSEDYMVKEYWCSSFKCDIFRVTILESVFIWRNYTLKYSEVMKNQVSNLLSDGWEWGGRDLCTCRFFVNLRLGQNKKKMMYVRCLDCSKTIGTPIRFQFSNLNINFPVAVSLVTVMPLDIWAIHHTAWW